MLQEHGQGYYGGWSAEIGYSSGDRRRENLTKQINSHIHEHVVDVNIESGWEMAAMVVKAILPEEPNATITYVDFMYDCVSMDLLYLYYINTIFCCNNNDLSLRHIHYTETPCK